MKRNLALLIPAAAAATAFFVAAVLAAEAHGRHRERRSEKAVKAL